MSARRSPCSGRARSGISPTSRSTRGPVSLSGTFDSLARCAATGAAWSAESVREVVDRLVVV